jgi:hypothetical protein
MMQHGLDLVVAGVRDGHVRAVFRAGDAVKKLIARGSGGFFEIQPTLTRVRRHIDFFDYKRNVPAAAELSGPGGIIVGGPGPHSVIEVGRDDPQSGPLGQCVKTSQQGDTIGPARHADKDAGVAQTEPIHLKRNLFQEVRRVFLEGRIACGGHR